MTISEIILIAVLYLILGVGLANLVEKVANDKSRDEGYALFRCIFIIFWPLVLLMFVIDNR